MPVSALRLARLNAERTLFSLQSQTSIQSSRLSLIERGLVAANADERRLLAHALDQPERVLFPDVGSHSEVSGNDGGRR